MTTEGTENHEPKTAAEQSLVVADPDNANLDTEQQKQVTDPKASGTPDADGTTEKGDVKNPEVEGLRNQVKSQSEHIAKLTADHAKSALDEQIAGMNAADDRASEADYAAIEAGDMTASEAKANATDRKAKTATAIEEASKPPSGGPEVLTPDQVAVLTELAVASRVDYGTEFAGKYGVDADTLINDTTLEDPSMMERKALELKVEAMEAGTWVNPAKAETEEKPSGEVFDGGTGSAATSNIDEMSTHELIQGGLNSR